MKLQFGLTQELIEKINKVGTTSKKSKALIEGKRQ